MKYYTLFLVLGMVACGRTELVQKPVPCTTVQVASGVQINCPDGTNSFVSNGVDGSPGIPGLNGDNVSMVQFCTGFATSYPSTFPEFGMCIQDKLYGTYWDGINSWTSEIVPGTYMSTSTSAPCNFVVADNCGVTTL